MPATRSQSQADKVRLKANLTKFLRIEEATYSNDPIVRALEDAGVTEWNNEFMVLGETYIDQLMVPGARATDPPVPLAPMPKINLKCLAQFAHDAARKHGSYIDLDNIDVSAFDAYRITSFNSTSKLVLWNEEKPEAVSTEMVNWKKNVRPSRSDFKEFRDITYWTRTKERIVTMLQAQNLKHLIDEKFKVMNKTLDDAQQAWLYKVFQDIMVEPSARKIVTDHLTTKQTRVIWKEICESLESSMTSELRGQKLTTYLSSTRFHELNWHGSQEAFILHYADPARIHTKIDTKNALNDTPLKHCLNACLAGTDNLSQVLTLHTTARKAAGNTTAITFSEYVALLMLQAQVHDAGRKSTTNPCEKRLVNNTELIFDEDEAEDVDTYEVDVTVSFECFEERNCD